MKVNIKGYPINKNGKVLTSILNEVVRVEYQGQTLKQNGTYLYFRFKRGNKFIYSE
jgi:hypothetical protein